MTLPGDNSLICVYVDVVCVSLCIWSFPLLGGTDVDDVTGGACDGGGAVWEAMGKLVLVVMVALEVVLLGVCVCVLPLIPLSEMRGCVMQYIDFLLAVQ